ncbi:DUF4173 domain-containing protein [Lachnospiraceae bacterium ZAX-1]
MKENRYPNGEILQKEEMEIGGGQSQMQHTQYQEGQSQTQHAQYQGGQPQTQHAQYQERQPQTQHIQYQVERPPSIIQKNFRFFALASAIYAVFYTLCLYENLSGVTFPFFIGGTLYYFYSCMKKLEVPWKKDAVFHMAGIILLGISVFLTDDERIIGMNYVGIFVLMVSFMIHHFYKDEKWPFGKYLLAICECGFRTIAAIWNPFHDVGLFLKTKDKGRDTKLKYVIIGLLISAPLLLLVMALLMSADGIFAMWSFRFLKAIQIPENVFGVLFTVLFAYIASYSFISALERRGIKEEVKNAKNAEPVIAITFTGILSVIYFIFSIVQIQGLFLGQMAIPHEYTYAKYAREGFFQLLFVCIINLLLVLICMALFRESKVLKIMLTVISGCTFIMIASSAYRMILYIDVYQLTFLRIFVLWSLLVIFILIAGILVNIYWKNFPLFRFSMTMVTVLYVLFSFSHPDYFIAKYNIKAIRKQAQMETKTQEYDGDYYYLGQLSADAASAFLSEDVSQGFGENEEYLQQYFKVQKNVYEKMSWREFNVSRYLAGRAEKVYHK